MEIQLREHLLKYMKKNKKIIVAVIAYNEAKNIANTLSELKEKNEYEYDIVVIDNSSSDNTVEIVKENGVAVVSHCVNTGSGFGTVTTYFSYACKMDYDILCQFDGDGQHIAAELSKIIKPVISDNADYVIGSRYIMKEGFQSSLLRRIGIRFFAKILSSLVGVKITDSTSGFKAYSKRFIRFMALNYRHEIYDSNHLIMLAGLNNMKIVEVPVKMRARQFGISEYNFVNSILYPIRGIINIIGLRLQFRNIHKKNNSD